ncbi:uncharacterized protein LOC118516621 [Anopheles stephensi]|uniref:uncharacterized protein LOC118516621 n=1 Tax=Anopheles stephensi TaxID=30069 RepID=UPI001658A779|nr:uncharacterized protein LOC118516621 [Anopheles stephensi]
MPKRNAFFWFMIEYKGQEEAKGRKIRSLAEITPEAGELWVKMDENQRQPYVVKANEGKGGTALGRLNSLGVSIDSVEHQLREKRAKDQMVRDLTDLRVMLAANKTELAKEVFYIISMEYFCCTYQGVYIPAELAVVKYSLASGVMDQLHLLIKASEIPLGYAAAAMERSGKTHQLPTPPDALGVADFGEIADRLLAFLDADGPLPLLFTDEEAMPAVECMLASILGKHGNDRLKQLHICPLAQLFYKLIIATERRNGEQFRSNVPSVRIAQQILSLDRYAYTLGISCDYHEGLLNTYHCALSRSVRRTYTISMYCCTSLGIQLIPGKHMPPVRNDGRKPAQTPNATVNRMLYEDLLKLGLASGEPAPADSSRYTADTAEESTHHSVHNTSMQSSSEVEKRLEHFRNISLAEMPASLFPPGESPLDRMGGASVSGWGLGKQDTGEAISSYADGNGREGRSMTIKPSRSVCSDGNTTLDRVSRKWKQRMSNSLDRTTGTSVASAETQTLTEDVLGDTSSADDEMRDVERAGRRPYETGSVCSVGNTTVDSLIDRVEVERRLEESIKLSKTIAQKSRSVRSQRDSTSVLDVMNASMGSSRTSKAMQGMELSDYRGAGSNSSSDASHCKHQQVNITSEAEKRLELAMRVSKGMAEGSRSVRSLVNHTLDTTDVSIDSSASKMRSRAGSKGHGGAPDNTTPEVEKWLDRSMEQGKRNTPAASVSSLSHAKSPLNSAASVTSSAPHDSNDADYVLTPVAKPRHKVGLLTEDGIDYDYEPACGSYRLNVFTKNRDKPFPTLAEAMARDSGQNQQRGTDAQQRGRGGGRGRGRGRGRARGRAGN